ncbi:Aste57867_12762 [Aphanomyces stellatus]|uniref:Aste57867_12762 protein n=1 Tax=Aphanomyces stellatus TaxID=120398 RepID=A0A485KYF4_9STRA|nr:hypothetical protein As57867_012714 [Aphanomyces stellatus]VFT89611.1 Aste57867_12762 [Aphanomyces stellatus]
MPQVAPTLPNVGPSPSLIQQLPKPSTWVESNLVLGAGLLYLVASLACSAAFLVQIEPNVANDFWWAGFNTTGTQTFLGDLFNLHLMWARTGDLPLLDPASGYVMKTYGDAKTVVEWSASYGRRHLLAPLPLDDVIRAMRANTIDANFRMVVPYCWLDLNRTFEMAHTNQRQQRCEWNERTNAAVHFETLVRNVAPHSLTTSTIGAAINATILDTLRTSNAGVAWIAAMDSHEWLSVADEVALWTDRGLVTWQNQMQNLNHDGIDDSIAIESALGHAQSIQIKKYPLTSRGVGLWSTYLATVGIWNDILWADSVGCSVLLRANNSIAAMGLNWDNDLLLLANTPSINIVRAFFGPFLSIDIKLVVPTTSLLTYNRHFQIYVYTLMDIMDLPPSVFVDASPPAWPTDGSLLYYGGNPMCSSWLTDAYPYVQRSFGYYESCSDQPPMGFDLAPHATLFALHLVSSQSYNVRDVCSCCTRYALDCVRAIDRMAVLYTRRALDPNPIIASEVHDVMVDTIALNISLMQMTTNPSQTDIDGFVLVQPIVLSNLTTDPFAFFGWTMVYDWLQGIREVYSFQGDEGAVTLITEASDRFHTTANHLELPRRACQYIWYLSIYVTGLLCLVGCLVLYYSCMARGQVRGALLFQFNRVVGSVWLGRPLLSLRGMTAIVVLSTAPVVFVTPTNNGRPLSLLHLVPRHFLVSCLFAGEVTWLTYVVHDVFLPFTTTTLGYTRLSSCLTFMLVVLYDQLTTVPVTATLTPDCHVTRVGLDLQCHSGIVRNGSFLRLCTLSLTATICVPLGTYFVAHCRKKMPRADPRAVNVIIPAAAQAFTMQDSVVGSSLLMHDPVAMAMAGTLTLPNHTLNMLVWRVFRTPWPHTPRFHSFQEPANVLRLDNSATVVDVSHRCNRRMQAMALLGFVYMVATVVMSYSYLVLTKSTMSNDFWWESFTSMGHQTFLTNWYTTRLQLTNQTDNIQVDSPAQGDVSINYTTTSPVMVPPLYANSIQDEVNTLEAVVLGLRTMDSCLLPWIASSYCYVDFGQQWEMATSESRQRQCTTEANNGAVYLEAMLRNAQWPELTSCWGDSLDVGLFAALRMTTFGATWITATHRATLSISDEVSYWKHHKIEVYTTQWQNYKQLGVTESFVVQNAFGLLYPLTLKKIPRAFQLPYPTSYTMQWPLASFLWAVSSNSSTLISGLSLVRNAGQSFALDNSTVEALLLQNYTWYLPWTVAETLTRGTLGPFGDVTMRRMGAPLAIRSLYGSLTQSIFQVIGTNSTALAQFQSMEVVNNAQPVAWQDLDHFGGNFMCDLGPNQGDDVGDGFTADGACILGGSDHIPTTVIASLAAQLTTGWPLNAIRIASCDLETKAHDVCRMFFTKAALFLVSAFSNATLQAISAKGDDAKRELMTTIRPQLVQYVATRTNDTANESTTMTLSRVDLLDDTAFDYFGWLMIFEWITGTREVVQFQGEVASMSILSGQMNPYSMVVNPQEVPLNVAFYIRSAIQYMTFVLLVVASLTCLFIILHRGYIEGFNMLQVNRVAGAVWLGRPLMALRGVTAICILSTSSLQVTQPGHGIFFQLAPAPFDTLTTLLSCSEMTWLVYVLNDMFSIVTGLYTCNYTWKCTAVVWLVAAAWSVNHPMHYRVRIDRQCNVDAVDFIVTCSSGTFEIGRLDHALGYVSVACIGCLIGYAWERVGVVIVKWLARRQATKNGSLNGHEKKLINASLLLHATAQHNFELRLWAFEGVYFLDKASAVLTGILALHVGDTFVMMDIKTWRVYSYVYAMESSLPEPLRRAIPLAEAYDNVEVAARRSFVT